MKNKITKGPQFVRYFTPLIQALKELDGSGRPAEAKDVIASKLGLAEKELDKTIESGVSRFSKQVDWAKFYLSQAGYIDASTRGVWSLTDKGRSYALSSSEEVELFKKIHRRFVEERKGKAQAFPSKKVEDIEITDELEAIEGYREKLTEILLKMPAKGFESLCQELLRESGFESVTVTGKSGDGGIDGIGVLQVNPLVSFKVLFQCKRHKNPIGSDRVRDFRGAMMGRADKGIILITSTFTPDAKKEAVRDGVPAIELVDLEKLLDMCEKLQFGLRPKQTFEVDHEFFLKFK